MAPAHRRSRNILLWAAFAVPAFAWFFQLCANYMLAAYACANDRLWILHGISAVALVLGGGGLACGWINWRHRNDSGAGDRGENRFITSSVLLLAALFFLTIAASEAANWFLEPCV